MPLLLLVLLVGYGNAKSLAIGTALPTDWWIHLSVSLALVVPLLAWARLPPRLSAVELGLAGPGAARAAVTGGLIALGAAAVALLVLRFPPLPGGPIRYGPLADLAFEPLVLRAFVLMPLDTVIPEEFGFRGVLLGRLRRTGGNGRAVLLSAAAFTLWHVAIVAATVGQTNLREASVLTLLGAVGALAAVFAGGVFFALLRIRTGHLAAPVAAHWTFNAAILIGLWPLVSGAL